jgi:hypothetical protein
MVLYLHQLDALSVVFLRWWLGGGVVNGMLTYHLTVFSSNDVQAAIGILYYKVSREVSSKPSITRPRSTVNERFTCLLVVVQISATYDGALNQKLPNATNRDERMDIIRIHNPSMATDGISNVLGIAIRSHPGIGDRSYRTLARALPKSKR